MKKDYKFINLIGFLLIIPIWIIIFISLNLLRIYDYDMLLQPIIIYSPIIIGLVLYFKSYNNWKRKLFLFTIILFLFFSMYFYYNAMFVDHPGWDNLGYLVFWLICMVGYRFLALIFCWKMFGWKRSLCFIFIYILIIMFLAAM